jgi:predicted acetyltransferase
MEFDTGDTSRVLLERGAQASDVRGMRLVAGNAGDHKLVHALLRAANQAPTYEDFLAGLDEPTYEPSDRLLVKSGNEIVAHVRVLPRSAWFEHAKLPIGGIEDLTALPEYCDQGYEQLLVSTAERALRDQQAVVAFAHTNQAAAGAFRDQGWSEVGSQRFTQANVNEVLGVLAAIETVKVARRQRPLRIRLWRQVELEGLRKVYHQAASAGWGAIDRSEAYWRWLTGRSIHDELIVAIHGPDK